MQFVSLGPAPLDYEEVRALQLEWVTARAEERVPDTVFFLEHTPVVTQGRGLQFTGQPRERHMPLPKLPPEIAFAESERGGDLTYHGPGQLVIYPILATRDVAATLRGLETALIAWLSTLGLKGAAHPDATGVWVGDRKIGSIGIAVRKWVTYHGAAINIVNDLKPFHLISPCGFEPQVMSSVSELLRGSGRQLDSNAWRAECETGIAAALSKVFGGPSEARTIQNLTIGQARKKGQEGGTS